MPMPSFSWVRQALPLAALVLVCASTRPLAAQEVKPTVLEGHTNTVKAVAFSKDGLLASASADGTIRLWDPAAKKAVGVLKGHESWVSTLAFSPDGKWLVSGNT